LSRRAVRTWWALGLLGLVGYLSTGLVVVPPGEAVVVRRLGRALERPWGPGLHLGWPRGFDRLTRLRTDEVRRLTVGRAGTPGPGEDPGSGEFLTGDANFLRAEATAFAVRAEAVEPVLTRLAEASLSRALAGRSIDATLRDGRADAAREAEAALARGAARYGLGVAILGVSLTDARPPGEVAPDFAAAQAARSDRDRRLNEAETYARTSETRARSEARARLERARSRADRAVTMAESRAGRFLSLQAEATDARPLTVQRLFLETLREILPRVGRKVVLTPDEPLDLSILGGNR